MAAVGHTAVGEQGGSRVAAPGQQNQGGWQSGGEQQVGGRKWNWKIMGIVGAEGFLRTEDDF